MFVATENEELGAKLAQKAQPRPLYMQVPLGDNFFAQVKLLLPPTLSGNHPMLVYV